MMNDIVTRASSALISAANQMSFAVTFFSSTKELYRPEKLMGTISEDHLKIQKLKYFKYFQRDRSRYIVTCGRAS